MNEKGDKNFLIYPLMLSWRRKKKELNQTWWPKIVLNRMWLCKTSFLVASVPIMVATPLVCDLWKSSIPVKGNSAHTSPFITMKASGLPARIWSLNKRLLIKKIFSTTCSRNKDLISWNFLPFWIKKGLIYF